MTLRWVWKRFKSYFLPLLWSLLTSLFPLVQKYWEPILAKGHVDYAGQAVALVLAVSDVIAGSAVGAVNV